MKRSLFSVLILAALITTQLKSHFIRGAIYQKDGKFIVLLGDFHNINFVRQRHELIESLKSFSKRQILTLVEDRFGNTPDNEDYLSTTKRLMSVEDFRAFSIPHLYGDLRRENLNVIDVEIRKMLLAFVNDLGNWIGKKIAVIAENLSRDYPAPKSENMINHVVEEIESNLKNLKNLLNQIKISDIEHRDVIVGYCERKIEELTTVSNAYIRALKNPPLGLLSIFSFGQDVEEVKLGFFAQQSISYVNISLPIIDVNLIQNIVANKDKKVTVICTGLSHTIEIEKIIEKIGYQNIYENGVSREIAMEDIVSCIPHSQKIQMEQASYRLSDVDENLTENIPAPIDVYELFEELKKYVPHKKSSQIVPLRYGKFTIVPHFLRIKRLNLFWDASIDKPLQGTSKIVKDQIRHNYHLMFPETRPLLAIEDGSGEAQ